MKKISFAILCNYVQSVATTFCLLLFPSISSYTCAAIHRILTYLAHGLPLTGVQPGRVAACVPTYAPIL